MLFLAVRHLTSRMKQTLLTLMGIFLGTGAYVAISGLMLGFQTFIIDQLVNNDAHVRISARQEPITSESLQSAFFPEGVAVRWEVPPSGLRDNAYVQNLPGVLARLEEDPRVFAFSQQLVVQALVSRGRLSVACKMIGARPERQVKVTNIEKYMLEGKYSDIGKGGHRVAVGAGLLSKIGARVGDSIMISAGKSEAIPFKVVSSFRLGVKTLDDSTLFASLPDAQSLAQARGQVTDVAVKLRDVSKAQEVAQEWAYLSGDKVQSWGQANEGILSVFKTQDIVRYFMTVSIIIVAGFGIYNVLSMTVNNKKREIAILRSIGHGPGDVIRLFLYQGLILGTIGGLLGIIAGYLASKGISRIEVSPDRGLGSGYMMVSFLPSIYIQGFFLAFFSSVAASWLPARAAGRLTPIDIIRSENS